MIDNSVCVLVCFTQAFDSGEDLKICKLKELTKATVLKEMRPLAGQS